MTKSNAVTIYSGELSKALQKILSKYGDDVTEATRRLVKRAGNEARDKLKQTSLQNTGRYAKNWLAGNYTWTALGAEITVYNAPPTYRLAHLLENGHANRGGGRTPAKVHIKPVEEEVGRELEKNIRQAIENV